MKDELTAKATIREQHHITFGCWSLVSYKRTFCMLSDVDEHKVNEIFANTIKQLEELEYINPEYEIVGVDYK